jgi:GT2 family glycosyltransferase
VKVTIIVVNYNGAAFLERLAGALRALTYPGFDLLVVDNASPDGSGALLGPLFPGARVILNPRNLGLDAAINQALGECLPARPKYVLLLNPDSEPAPDMLDRLVEVADARTLVVPRVVGSDGRLAGHAGRFDLRRGLLLDTHDGEPDPGPAGPREVETGSFSCLLAPAAMFERAGLLDERLGMYYEDTDFCLRVRAAGGRVLLHSAALLRHSEGGSSGGRESAFAVYYTTRNRPYIVRKHASTLDYLAFSLYFLAGRALKAIEYLRAGRKRHLRALLLGLRDFYLGRMGMTWEASDLL